jgi:CDP-glucose 4,6-dehydratase
MSRHFWRNRRVLLTGHTGFKGTWLSLWLQSLGAEITGYALADEPDPALRMFEIVDARSGMVHVDGDVRDRRALMAAVTRAQPEVVIHMAAQALVRRGYRAPAETFDTNVMGTVNLLDACRHCESVRAVVIVTTDKCYDNREWEWGYREHEPMGGHDPYSASKGCAELVTAAYRRSFFGEGPEMHPAFVASARAGNVIGGGDWAEDRLIPDIVRAFSRGESVLIRSPHATRPWQHVLEPLSGYLLLAQRLVEEGRSVADAWNFGPEDTDVRPVSWVIDYMATRWGHGATHRIDQARHPHEAGALRLDISKARHRLNWQPKLRIEQTLDWLVEWYRRYYAGHRDLRELTLKQIETYAAIAPGLHQPGAGSSGFSKDA